MAFDLQHQVRVGLYELVIQGHHLGLIGHFRLKGVVPDGSLTWMAARSKQNQTTEALLTLWWPLNLDLASGATDG